MDENSNYSSIDDLTKEELQQQLSDQMMLSSYIAFVFSNSMISHYGDEGKKLAEKILFEIGEYVGDKLLTSGYVKQMGMDGFLKFVELFSTLGHVKKQIVSHDENEAVIVATDCPLGMMFEIMGETQGICKVLCKLDLGVCSSLGFSADYTLNKTISAGDNCCEYQLKRK